MERTPASLLERLRQPCPQAAWHEFVQLYTPLLYYWARRAGRQSQDAADLVQDVFVTLVQALPQFAYDPGKSFRSWLRTILLNKLREKQRQRTVVVAGTDNGRLPDVAGPDTFQELSEEEYRQHLVRRALDVMQTDFEPLTWRACWEYLVAGRPAAEVATELGVSPGVVYAAKSRVLQRLRQELKGLLD
jgi:RNA polymerase sigma-70 factor (ECF subfamily)